jgi:hypothetical protein
VALSAVIYSYRNGLPSVEIVACGIVYRVPPVVTDVDRIGPLVENPHGVRADLTCINCEFGAVGCRDRVLPGKSSRSCHISDLAWIERKFSGASFAHVQRRKRVGHRLGLPPQTIGFHALAAPSSLNGGVHGRHVGGVLGVALPNRVILFLALEIV